MKKKLTAVTISANGRRVQTFIMCEHLEKGGAVIPNAHMTTIEKKLHIQRNDTLTIG